MAATKPFSAAGRAEMARKVTAAVWAAHDAYAVKLRERLIDDDPDRPREREGASPDMSGGPAHAIAQ
jgi:hypothetical protein